MLSGPCRIQHFGLSVSSNCTLLPSGFMGTKKCQILPLFPANIPICVWGPHRDVFCAWCQFLLNGTLRTISNQQKHTPRNFGESQPEPILILMGCKHPARPANKLYTACLQTAAGYDSNAEANQTTPPRPQIERCKQHVTFPKFHYMVHKDTLAKWQNNDNTKHLPTHCQKNGKKTTMLECNVKKKCGAISAMYVWTFSMPLLACLVQHWRLNPINPSTWIHRSLYIRIFLHCMGISKKNLHT